MDILHLAVFAVALGLGLAQHLTDRNHPIALTAATPRWWANGVLFAADTACITLFAGAATWLTRTGAEPVLPQTAIRDLPVAAQIGVLLIAQGFLQYWIHRAGHRLPLLWGLHRIHHTDTQLDATTGLRHHPLETIVDYLVLLLPMLILSPSAGGLFAYFMLTIGFAMFTHMNPVWLPARVDRALSKVIMTPRLHQLHHSTWQPETDTNYGNVLVIWDRLFGTYLPAPDTPRAGFALGLDTFPADRAADPFLLMASPFLAHDLRDGTAARD